MAKQQIQLTEQDLHFLVEDAVKQYMIQEGWWGGVKNAYRGVRNGNFDLSRSYKTGNWASSFQTYANQAEKLIGNMMKVAKESTNNDVAQSLQQVLTNIQNIAAQFNNNARQATQAPTVRSFVNNPFTQQ